MGKAFPGTDVNSIVDGKYIESYGIKNGKVLIAGELYRYIPKNKKRKENGEEIEQICFIRSKIGNYLPTCHDIVIGKIVHATSEYYRIDLNGTYGCLPVLSFLNATKKNRPDLRKDDWIIGRVERISDGDLLISCKETNLGKAKDVFEIDGWKIREIYLRAELDELDISGRLSVGLGMNGFISLDGEDPEEKRKMLFYLRNLYGSDC